MCFISVASKEKKKIAKKSRRLLIAVHILIKTYQHTRRRKRENQHKRMLFIKWWVTHTHSVRGIWDRKVGGASMRRKLLRRKIFSTELDTNFLTQKWFSSQKNLCQSKTRRKKSLVWIAKTENLFRDFCVMLRRVFCDPRLRMNKSSLRTRF